MAGRGLTEETVDDGLDEGQRILLDQYVDAFWRKDIDAIVRLLKAVVPTAPPNVVVPLVFTVKLSAPAAAASTVVSNVTSPAARLVSVVLAPRTTVS